MASMIDMKKYKSGLPDKDIFGDGSVECKCDHCQMNKYGGAGGNVAHTPSGMAGGCQICKKHKCICQPNKKEFGDRCNQCELENNTGICDKKDCSNYPTPPQTDKTTWEERYWKLWKKHLIVDANDIHKFITEELIKKGLLDNQICLEETAQALDAYRGLLRKKIKKIELEYHHTEVTNALDEVIALLEIERKEK